MSLVGGPLGVTVIAVVVALVVLFAILHFGFHVFRRRKGKGRARSGVTNDSRVEVLETTVIDEERKLVLIRCDRIEHLIMIGGAGDLVVENDVRKVRAPGAPPAKVPGIDTEKRVPAIQRSMPPAATASHDAPKTPEPVRQAPRPISDVRQPPAAATRSIPPIQPAPGRPGARNGAETPAAPPVRTDDSRAAAQRPQPVDSKSGRRDTAPARRTPVAPPSTVGRGETLRAAPMSAANDRHARPVKAPARSSEPSPGLPAAQIPWSDPDSIENEIVRALKFDPHTRSDQNTGRRETPMPRAIVDSTTTLGDLADKLEEALAREVQSAGQPHRPGPAAEDFGFENAATPALAERAKPTAQKERSDRRDRSEPSRAAKLAPTPDAEPPAHPERREEAPVISLNSRRRESADQLEDEMARLLGELTSDNKGR